MQKSCMNSHPVSVKSGNIFNSIDPKLGYNKLGDYGADQQFNNSLNWKRIRSISASSTVSNSSATSFLSSDTVAVTETTPSRFSTSDSGLERGCVGTKHPSCEASSVDEQLEFRKELSTMDSHHASSYGLSYHHSTETDSNRDWVPCPHPSTSENNHQPRALLGKHESISHVLRNKSGTTKGEGNSSSRMQPRFSQSGFKPHDRRPAHDSGYMHGKTRKGCGVQQRARRFSDRGAHGIEEGRMLNARAEAFVPRPKSNLFHQETMVEVFSCPNESSFSEHKDWAGDVRRHSGVTTTTASSFPSIESLDVPACTENSSKLLQMDPSPVAMVRDEAFSPEWKGKGRWESGNDGCHPLIECAELPVSETHRAPEFNCSPSDSGKSSRFASVPCGGLDAGSNFPSKSVSRRRSTVPIVVPTLSGKKVQYSKTKVCPWNAYGRCVMGDKCNYAHTKDELRGRPDLACTRLCSAGSACTRSNCRYAHDPRKLRATGAFFRTKLCKFWRRGYCPAGDECRHAHGEEQLRRPSCNGDDGRTPLDPATLSKLYSQGEKVATKPKMFSDSHGGKAAGHQVQARNCSFSPSYPSRFATNRAEQCGAGSPDSHACMGAEEPTPEIGSVQGNGYGVFECSHDNAMTQMTPPFGAQLSPELVQMLSEWTSEANSILSPYPPSLLGSKQQQVVLDEIGGTSCIQDYIGFPSPDGLATEGPEHASLQKHALDLESLLDDALAGNDSQMAHYSVDPLSSQFSPLKCPIYPLESISPQPPSTPSPVGNSLVESVVTPPFTMPSTLHVDPATVTSASKLRLGDLLRLAVDCEDPDLLECSAKLLRMSQKTIAGRRAEKTRHSNAAVLAP